MFNLHGVNYDNMLDLVYNLPKAELHLHLHGAISHEAIMILWNKYIQYLSTEDKSFVSYLNKNKHYDNLRYFYSPQILLHEIENLFVYEDFYNFLATFGIFGFLIRKKDDLEMLIDDVLSDLIKQNVLYAEITITVSAYMRSGLTLEEVLECMDSACMKEGITIYWIVDLVRNSGPDKANSIFEDINSYGPAFIKGFTLGGDEKSYSAHEFKFLYEKIRCHNYHTTIHSGEVGTSEDLWDAIKNLELDRIGHGISAANDPYLLHYLEKKRLPLEVCITSNVTLLSDCTFANHPVTKLFSNGVCLTINTDDPTFFNTTLTDEYRHLLLMDFSVSEVLSLARNSFEVSFAPLPTKNELLHKFDTFLVGIDELINTD